LADLSALWDEIAPQGAILRILIDHPDQVRFLENFERNREHLRRWSVFVKVDGGQRYDNAGAGHATARLTVSRRAGVSLSSPVFKELMIALFTSPVVSVHGFYGHAGDSYASKSLTEASSYLFSEVATVDSAAAAALSIFPNAPQPFVLSVGATPTAHAASAETRYFLSKPVHGTLELHAGWQY
jgi:D-serine ammonia-lyase